MISLFFAVFLAIEGVQSQISGRAATLPFEPSFQGCFGYDSDTPLINITARIDSGAADWPEFEPVISLIAGLMMMNQRCARLCNYNGYPIAATTMGKTCFCSLDLPQHIYAVPWDKASSGSTGKCNMYCQGAYNYKDGAPCTGDYCCGGEGALSVYYVGEVDALGMLVRRAMSNLQKNGSELIGKLLSGVSTPIYNATELEKITLEVVHEIADSSGVLSNERVTFSYSYDPQKKLTSYSWDSKTVNTSIPQTVIFRVVEKKTVANESAVNLLPIQSTPAGHSIELNNINSSTAQKMTKMFSTQTVTSSSHFVQTGISSSVSESLSDTISDEVGGIGFQMADTTSFSVGTTYKNGYTNGQKESDTEQYSIELEAPPNSIATTKFSYEIFPRMITWRATLVADGQCSISVYRNGKSGTFQSHLVEISSEEDRTFYSFGNDAFSGSPTVTATTTISGTSKETKKRSTRVPGKSGNRYVKL
eukprot:m.88034 g.88034  ORF g.88034 m.88034 type:complete len:477 (+) comp36554_c0_seq2:689-2119(+)